MHGTTSTTLSAEYPTVMLRTSGQIRRLLMLAGDIESNPGPEQQAADDGLIAGLADLVGQAPAGMRDVLCVWSPQKPSNVIVSELSNRKFTLSVLQPVLAWLLNKNVSDPIIKSLKKGDIAQEIILGIERLLPDTCSECKQEYTVGRQDKPGLRCQGCGQGFHQPCLESLLGGKTTLPALPGSLYWLCGSCAPCYELVTTVGQGGRSKPGRKRLVSVLPDTSEQYLPPSEEVVQSEPLPPTNTGAVPSGQASNDSSPKSISAPPATVRAGLPYLWAVGSEQARLGPGTASPPPPPPPLTSLIPKADQDYHFCGLVLAI